MGPAQRAREGWHRPRHARSHVAQTAARRRAGRSVNLPPRVPPFCSEMSRQSIWRDGGAHYQVMTTVTIMLHASHDQVCLPHRTWSMMSLPSALAPHLIAGRVEYGVSLPHREPDLTQVARIGSGTARVRVA